MMKELLSKMVGQEVDVLCTGTSSLRGKVVKVEGDVLTMPGPNSGESRFARY